MSRKRIARLMWEQSLRGRRRCRQPRMTDSRHPFRVADNMLNRAFDVATPNTVWGGDFTYLATREGWIHLAVLIDHRPLFATCDRIRDERGDDAKHRFEFEQAGINVGFKHVETGSGKTAAAQRRGRASSAAIARPMM